MGGEVGMKEIIIEVPDKFGKALKPEKVNSKIKGELVRCRDCKHYRYYGLSQENVSECKIDIFENPDENWFCSEGER